RSVWIVHVSAEAVLAPGRRHELHRALCTCGTRAEQLSKRGLDEVHRSQYAPWYAETPLGLLIPAEEIRGGSSRADVDLAYAKRRRDVDELAVCRHDVPGEGCKWAWEPCQRLSGERRIARKEPVQPLVVQRIQGD